MTRCLVTGGAGFIGSHLVDRLVAEGNEVVIVDDLSTGKRENLASLSDSIEFIEGDICDSSMVSRAAQGCELVFHLAALVSVPLSVEKPELSARINDQGTLNVFTAARDAGARRVVYSSSSAVYGDVNTPPHSESSTLSPTSPYAAHKLLGEVYAEAISSNSSLEFVSLRYFNVYGPRQDPGSPYSGVISIFMDKLRGGEAVTIHGDGEQTRDFIYVEDVVRVNLIAARLTVKNVETFNVGSGSAVSINELLRLLFRVTKREVNVLHVAARAGDVRHSSAEVEKMLSLPGFEEPVVLETGLEMTFNWFSNK